LVSSQIQDDKSPIYHLRPGDVLLAYEDKELDPALELKDADSILVQA